MATKKRETLAEVTSHRDDLLETLNQIWDMEDAEDEKLWAEAIAHSRKEADKYMEAAAQQYLDILSRRIPIDLN